MKNRKMVVWGMTLVCGLVLGSEAFARSGEGQGQGGGDQLRLRDGSCTTTPSVPQASQTQAATAGTPIRQRLQDGSCLTSPCDQTRQRLQDGTGSMNGAGYGMGDVLPDTDEVIF